MNNDFKERFLIEKNILSTINKIWEINKNYKLGFIENKVELKIYCKNLTNVDLKQILKIIMDDYKEEQKKKLERDNKKERLQREKEAHERWEEGYDWDSDSQSWKRY